MAITPLPGASRAGLFSLACTEAMWLATLLLLPLVMNVSVARSFEASKLMAVAPLAALCLAGLVAALLERAAFPSRDLLTSAPALAFGALIACELLATAVSETPWIAFFGDYFRREGLVSWLIYATLFAAVLLVLTRREQVERLIDVLIIGTVVPCVYAIMQRYGHDFFLTQGLLVGTAAARPGGTMGNPTFLASLLLLIIPVTIARVLTGSQPWARRAPWVIMLGLQLFAVLLTQSRGPLIGVAITLFVLVLLLGAQHRARTLILCASGAVLALALAVALVNLVPALAQATAGTPLQRFVFTSGDLTVSARVGIWQAGMDSFLHAPWWRQLIGYGADASSFNYFNWMPASVQRTEGYSETIDRLHSEFLETLLTFGVLGVAAQVALFSSLVWTAAQRLLPVPGARRAAPLGYAALVLAGLAAGAALAYGMGGNRGILPIGAGAGLGFSWVLFLAWRAWRSVRGEAPAAANALQHDDALLLAALISGLIGSWVETQVGVPTIANRALIAVYAALCLLAIHSAWRRAVPDPLPAAPAGAAAAPLTGRRARNKRVSAAQPAATARGAAAAGSRSASSATGTSGGWYPALGWSVALVLMVAVADFFPPLSGTRMQAPSVQRLDLIIWPLLLVALAGMVMAYLEGLRHATPGLQTLTRFMLWSVPAPLLFVIVHAKLGAAIDTAGEADLGARISVLSEFAFAAYCMMALAYAVALAAGERHRQAQLTRRSGVAGLAVLAAGAVLGLSAFLAVRADFGADVRAKLAAWSHGQGRDDAAAGFLKEALEMMPMERRFAGSYAARLVESSSAQFGQIATRPEAAQEMLAKLHEAERALIAARKLAPRDPWLTFAYANVHQFMALKALERAQSPAMRLEHAQIARDALALAHQQFPGHPWILRNWAQLELDQGNRDLAYAKLTEMEKLDPQNGAAYTEWVKFARLGNNPAVALAAVRRGLDALPKDSDAAAALFQELIGIPRDAGQIGLAINGAIEYTSSQPERINAWRQLSELYERIGQRDLALRNAQDTLTHFAGAKLTPAEAADYAVIKAQAERLSAGLAGAPGQPAGLAGAPGQPAGLAGAPGQPAGPGGVPVQPPGPTGAPARAAGPASAPGPRGVAPGAVPAGPASRASAK